MRRLSYLWLIMSVVLWVGRARAASVAIFEPAGDAPALSEALFRLKGELLAVGLSVTRAERPPLSAGSAQATRAWLEQVATERGIDAFIDVIGDDAPLAVEVWVWERAPHRLRATRVALDPDAENAAATLAIRSIEVLRSSLIAMDLSVPPEAPPPAAASESSAAASEPPPSALRLGLSAGATALTSLDGVGPAVLPLVRFDLALPSGLTLEATAAGLGTRPHVPAPAGSVEVAQQFALLGLCANLAGSPRSRAIAALSLGALRTGLDGSATSPQVGHTLERWAFLLEASVGARLRVVGDAYVTLAAHAQLAEPYVAIHSVDTLVATTGRPNLRLTLTAGAWL